MKNKIELLAIGSIICAMIMIFGSAKAEDVHVNRDSIGTNGAVNQVVVVNPQPAAQRRTVVVKEPVVNNYYNEILPNHDSDHAISYPTISPANFEPSSKFDYQDIWLMVMSILFAVGLGMFIGYLIWSRHGSQRQVIVHSHGGSSSTSSSSSSGARSVSGRDGSPKAASPSPTPVSPAPAAPAVEAPAPSQEEKK